MRQGLRRSLAAVWLAFVWAAVPILAHHSFNGEFDSTKPIKLTGRLTKVEWMNPHIWYYIDVSNPDGTVTNWGLSGGAPGQLQRRGITKDRLRIGAIVTVEGFRARDGSNNGFGSRVMYEDGSAVFTAGPQDRQGR